MPQTDLTQHWLSLSRDYKYMQIKKTLKVWNHYWWSTTALKRKATPLSLNHLQIQLLIIINIEWATIKIMQMLILQDK